MWKNLLKIVVSILILALLFHQIHFRELLPYFEKISLLWFAIAFVVQIFGWLAIAIRWYLIMNATGFKAPFKFYLKSYLKAVMFNQILPSTVGGDAYRMIEAAQLNQGKKNAVLGVLLDRFYGFIGLTVLSLLSLPFAYSLLPTNVFHIVVLINVVFIFGLILLLSLHRISLPFLRTVFDALKDFSRSMVLSLADKNSVLLKFVLMILPNFIAVCVFFFLARSLGVNGNLSDFLVIIPSVIVLTIMPVSVAGWGVREGALVFLGGLIGIAKPEALAISLLYGFVLILTSMPGMYFYLVGRSLKK